MIFTNVKTIKTIVCTNILDSENPYHTETTHQTRTANQLNGFYEIKGLTIRNFPTDFKSEYWHRNKNIIKSHKNAVKHVKFMWFNYDHGNSSDFAEQPKQ